MDASLTNAGSAVLGASDAAPERRWPLRGTRTWFVLFVGWMTALAVAALVLFSHYEQGDPLALRAWILVLMCFYLSLCNTFLPLPTVWIILLAASPEYALVQSGPLRVLLVAGLSTFATIVANLSEYHVLAQLFEFGLGRRIRRTRLYGWSVRWFDRAPFQLLALIAFVPVPIDAVRWLAVLRGYSRVRFSLAYLVGRGPRYLLFAWCSVLLELGAGQILLIQAVLLALALVSRLVWSVVRRGRRSAEASSAGTTLDAAAHGADG